MLLLLYICKWSRVCILGKEYVLSQTRYASDLRFVFWDICINIIKALGNKAGVKKKHLFKTTWLICGKPRCSHGSFILEPTFMIPFYYTLLIFEYWREVVSEDLHYTCLQD